MKNIIKIMTILSIFMIITGCKQRYKDNPGFKTDTDYTVYINQTSGGVGMENYGFFVTKDGKLYLYQCNYDNEPNYYSDFPDSFEEESKNYEPMVIIPQKEVDELLEKADNADLDKIEKEKSDVVDAMSNRDCVYKNGEFKEFKPKLLGCKDIIDDWKKIANDRR